MSRRSKTALVVILVGALLATTLTPVAALERGEPNIEVFLPENEVQPGGETALEVQLQNDAELEVGTGQEVLTARGVSVEVEDAGPFESKSGEAALGPIQDGSIATSSQRLAVPEDVEPGEYDIELRVRYAYTNILSEQSGTAQRLTASETHEVTVEVPDEPRFEISDVETDVEPGATGDATFEVENVGTQAANDTEATITGGGGLTIDGGNAEAVLGDLETGESTSVAVEAALAEGASDSVKPAELAFTYRDENGIEREAGPETASLVPSNEQTFSIEDLEDTLSVGYDGEVTGTLVNDGPRTIDDGVLVVEPMSDSLFVEDTRYALPEIAPGESADFRYPTDVSGSADEGPRQLRFSVQYTDDAGSTLESTPISERAVVDPRQDEFSIADDDVSVDPGESREVSLEITNERPETLSNIDARLYTDSPLSSADDEAFVDELDPGESASLRFEVSAEDGASAEAHPVELDFEYDTEDGSSVLSETYQHPIHVGDSASEGNEGGASLGATLGGALAVILAATLGITYWRRRG